MIVSFISFKILSGTSLISHDSVKQRTENLSTMTNYSERIDIEEIYLIYWTLRILRHTRK